MNDSPLPTRYAIPGAVPDPQSPEIAWHFGDPLGEQRAAAESAAVVDRSDRVVIEVAGPERLTWLHTLVSQFVEDLADRRSAESLSLDANGRVEDHFVITDVDGVAWIDTEASRGEELAAYLTKMIFWAEVTVTLRPEMTVLTLIGPALRRPPIADLLEIGEDADVYAAGDLPEGRHDEEPLGFWRIMPPIGADRDLPTIDLVLPESQVGDWRETLAEAGAGYAGSWAYEALRVAARRPRLGHDTDEKTIPQEADWIGTPAEQGAVHLDKGCYRGQETVARVHNLGKPPRRLVLLHLDGSSDYRPATGDQITAGGRAVGRLGTVVDHFEYGPIALALLRRSIPADTELLVGDPAGPDSSAAASIDPDSYVADDEVPAGRAAINRLRGRD